MNLENTRTLNIEELDTEGISIIGDQTQEASMRPPNSNRKICFSKLDWTIASVILQTDFTEKTQINPPSIDDWFNVIEENEYDQIIKYSLDEPRLLESTNPKSKLTGLEYAVSEDQDQLVALLLKLGANRLKRNVNENENNNSMLQKTISNDSSGITKSLLRPEYNSDQETINALVNQENNRGETALHSAMYCNDTDIEIMKLLIENTLDIDKQNQFKQTPLHLLISNINHSDLEAMDFDLWEEKVQLLVEYGKAEINAVTCFGGIEGLTPLHLLFDANDDPELQTIDVETQANFDSAKINVSLLLIRMGADVSALNSLGEQPLHYLARNSTHQMINSLISPLITAGANINSQCESGCTALHEIQVSEFNSIKSLQLLINFGADINPDDQIANPPFISYITETILLKPSYLKSFILLGANLQTHDSEGRTPPDLIRIRDEAQGNNDELNTLRQTLKNPESSLVKCNAAARKLYTSSGYEPSHANAIEILKFGAEFDISPLAHLLFDALGKHSKKPINIQKVKDTLKQLKGKNPEVYGKLVNIFESNIRKVARESKFLTQIFSIFMLFKSTDTRPFHIDIINQVIQFNSHYDCFTLSTLMTFIKSEENGSTSKKDKEKESIECPTKKSKIMQQPQN